MKTKNPRERGSMGYDGSYDGQGIKLNEDGLIEHIMESVTHSTFYYLPNLSSHSSNGSS